MKRHSTDMLQGSLWRGVMSYTIPIILTGLLQLAFNAADLVVVGRFGSSLYVGAVSSTGAITNLIINLFIGLSVGCGVSTAHALGGRRDQEVHCIVHTALPTAIVSGLVLTAIGVPLCRPLLELMDTPASVLPYSTKYMQIYFGGITFSMVYNFCASILRAAGDTKSPLIFLSIAGVINVVLNVIFVIGFHMDVDGVALATMISQAVSAVLVVRTLMRRTDACKLELKKLRFYKAPLLKMVRVGLPAGLQGSLFSISNVMIQSSINSFQLDAVISGNGAAGNIEGFLYTTMNAFHQSAVNFTGQNVGAQQYRRTKKVLLVCMTYVTLVGIAGGVLLRTFGRGLLGVYITDSPEAIEYGLIRLTYICLPYFLCGMQDVATGVLRGLGQSLAPMIICVLGICGFRILWISTIFQIPQYHTLPCLYLSYTTSWIITLICLLAFALFCFRKLTRKEPEPDIAV